MSKATKTNLDLTSKLKISEAEIESYKKILQEYQHELSEMKIKNINEASFLLFIYFYFYLFFNQPVIYHFPPYQFTPILLLFFFVIVVNHIQSNSFIYLFVCLFFVFFFINRLKVKF